MSGDRSLYIDRGVLLNLCATGHMGDILKALPFRCIILDEMCQSPLMLWTNSQEDEGLVEHEGVSIASLVSAGVLEVEHFEQERYGQAFVAFASYIPDRQAALLTLAEQLDATLAVDDKRIRRVLHRLAPYVPIKSTLSCLYTWQMSLRLLDSQMQPILRKMAYRAQFTPSDGDPLLDWWQRIVR